MTEKKPITLQCSNTRERGTIESYLTTGSIFAQYNIESKDGHEALFYDGQNSQRIGKLGKNDVSIIRYRFDISDTSDSVQLIRDSMQYAFGVAELTANIGFIKAKDGEKADIVIRAERIDKTIVGQYQNGVITLNTVHYDASGTPTKQQKGVALHELGHALGLQHPNHYNDNGGHKPAGCTLPVEADYKQRTVMSYRGDYPENGYGPMDIAALQAIYGPISKPLSGDLRGTLPESAAFPDIKWSLPEGFVESTLSGEAAKTDRLPLKGEAAKTDRSR